MFGTASLSDRAQKCFWVFKIQHFFLSNRSLIKLLCTWFYDSNWMAIIQKNISECVVLWEEGPFCVRCKIGQTRSRASAHLYAFFVTETFWFIQNNSNFPWCWIALETCDLQFFCPIGLRESWLLGPELTFIENQFFYIIFSLV